MKYAYYRTDGTAKFIETEKPIQYEQLRELVEGGIEGYTTQHGEHVYLNDEGRLDNLPSNPFFFEDIRGHVVVFGDVDGDGESLGVSDDYVLRSPVELKFEDGKKYTVFFIGQSMPMTGSIEFTSRGMSGSRHVVTVKGKRKQVILTLPKGEMMTFEGWDLPLMTASDYENKKPSDGSGFRSIKMRMNALYNFGGMAIDEMRKFIEEKQINPFFVGYDRILHIGNDVETLVFPERPASCQRIADMQSAQLKDGVSRMVIA